MENENQIAMYSEVKCRNMQCDDCPFRTNKYNFICNSIKLDEVVYEEVMKRKSFLPSALVKRVQARGLTDYTLTDELNEGERLV